MEFRSIQSNALENNFTFVTSKINLSPQPLVFLLPCISCDTALLAFVKKKLLPPKRGTEHFCFLTE
jgi:hypothetical protein